MRLADLGPLAILGGVLEQIVQLSAEQQRKRREL